MASRHKKKKQNNNPKRFTLQRRAGNSDCSYRQRWLGVPGRPTRGPHRKGVLVTAVRRCGCRYGAAAGPFLSRKHPGKRFPSRTWCSPGNARLRGGGGGGLPQGVMHQPRLGAPPVAPSLSFSLCRPRCRYLKESAHPASRQPQTVTAARPPNSQQTAFSCVTLRLVVIFSLQLPKRRRKTTEQSPDGPKCPWQGVGGNSSAPSQPEAVNSSSSRDAPRAIGAPEPLLPTAAAEQSCPIAAISLCHRTSPHFTKLIFTEVHRSASFPFLFKEKKKIQLRQNTWLQ